MAIEQQPLTEATVLDKMSEKSADAGLWHLAQQLGPGEAGLCCFSGLVFLFSLTGQIQFPLSTITLLAMVIGMESLACALALYGSAVKWRNVQLATWFSILSLLQVSLIVSGQWWGLLIFAALKSVSVASLVCAQQQANNLGVVTAGDSSRKSLAVSSSDAHHASPANNWLQQSQHQNEQSVCGELKLAFAAGQVQQEVNIPFVPVLSCTPELEAEAVDGDLATVAVDAVYAHGCRLMVRRQESYTAGTVIVAYEARTEVEPAKSQHHSAA